MQLEASEDVNHMQRPRYRPASKKPMEWYNNPKYPTARWDYHQAETEWWEFPKTNAKWQEKPSNDLHEICSTWAHTLPNRKCTMDAGNASSSQVGEDMANAFGSGHDTTSATPPGFEQQSEDQVLRRFRPREISLGATTLMVRNIPPTYTQERLLLEWVPDGTYDLLYAPRNERNMRPLGYAFINFLLHDYALQFQAKWHGMYLKNHGNTKYLDISVANLQGFENSLMNSMTKQSSRNRDLMPAVFSGTERLDTVKVLDGLMMQQPWM